MLILDNGTGGDITIPVILRDDADEENLLPNWQISYRYAHLQYINYKWPIKSLS